MNSNQFIFVRSVSEIVSNFCSNVSCEVAEFIGCQFALESAFGTSKLAQKYDNYSGMKFPKSRPRICFEIAGSLFADYYSLSDCVLDYLFCLAYHKVGSYDLANIERFSAAIKAWYCPDEDYITKITSIYKSFKSYKDE